MEIAEKNPIKGKEKTRNGTLSESTGGSFDTEVIRLSIFHKFVVSFKLYLSLFRKNQVSG